MSRFIKVTFLTMPWILGLLVVLMAGSIPFYWAVFFVGLASTCIALLKARKFGAGRTSWLTASLAGLLMFSLGGVITSISFMFRETEVRQDISTETNLTPIQEQFVSQSTMTAHSINNTYSVLSVGKELALGLHEVKVATGSGKNERMVIFSALYFGAVKGSEEVDLIRIEQSGSDPYESSMVNGLHFSWRARE